MVSQLWVESGETEGSVFSFEGTQNEWFLGADPSLCSFVSNDPSISSLHLRFFLEEGKLFVEPFDESDQNWINDLPLNQATPLNDGDLLRLGELTLRYNEDRSSLHDLADGASLSQTNEVSQETMDGEEEVESDMSSRQSVFESRIDDEGAEAPEIHFDFLEGGRFLLKVIAGPNNGAEFSLEAGSTYILGTDPVSADIIFHDISVSRQHAKISLSENGEIDLIDMGSRNGIYIEENRVETSSKLQPNQLVALGTSSFIILDTEGERSTIISPFLPSIVKVLQREGEKKQEAVDQEKKEESPTKNPEGPAELAKEPTFSVLGAFVLIAFVSGVFGLFAIGIKGLMQTETRSTQFVNSQKVLETILAAYPQVKFSYNESSQKLLLLGHVLTSIDRSQLLLALQTLPFIKYFDDNIVVDEYVWREQNQILAQNPEWNGVSMVATTPGVFTVTGVVRSLKQLESLADYLNKNFAYRELLELKVVVEEDLLDRVSSLFRSQGFGQLRIAFADGQLRVVGGVGKDQAQRFQEILKQLEKVPGIRSIQNLVSEQKAEGVTNISSRYRVSGLLDQGKGGVSVVINGRLLMKGDSIDGMTITDIKQEAIFLEKDGERYKIDYNK